MGVAERLAALRQRAGLSQGEVAERLNVSRQAVSRWETGLTIPSIDNLARLSRLYGITLDELLGHSPVLPPEPPQEGPPSEAETPAPAAVPGKPTHTRAVIIALSILCLLLAISTGVLLHQKYSENRELTFDEMESESIEDADIDEFQFG